MQLRALLATRHDEDYAWITQLMLAGFVTDTIGHESTRLFPHDLTQYVLRVLPTIVLLDDTFDPHSIDVALQIYMDARTQDVTLCFLGAKSSQLPPYRTLFQEGNRRVMFLCRPYGQGEIAAVLSRLVVPTTHPSH